MPRGQSDVYVSGRTLGWAAKVSIHEPGPARFALTKNWVRDTNYQAPAGHDSRLAVEWNRPRPSSPLRIARPLCIIVPFDEVVPRGIEEVGTVNWVSPPNTGEAIHFDIVYVPAGTPLVEHPGATSMGTRLVGSVNLANGQTVFVTSLSHQLSPQIVQQIADLRAARVTDTDGREVDKVGMMSFGREPNPDAQDGTEIGILVDVTRTEAHSLRNDV